MCRHQQPPRHVPSSAHRDDDDGECSFGLCTGLNRNTTRAAADPISVCWHRDINNVAGAVAFHWILGKISVDLFGVQVKGYLWTQVLNMYTKVILVVFRVHDPEGLRKLPSCVQRQRKPTLPALVGTQKGKHQQCFTMPEPTAWVPPSSL